MADAAVFLYSHVDHVASIFIVVELGCSGFSRGAHAVAVIVWKVFGRKG